MTRKKRAPQTLRWMIKRTRVSGGRQSGLNAWAVYRYRWTPNPILGRIRIVEAVLGLFPTLPAAMDSARRDCAVFYDERSRP